MPKTIFSVRIDKELKAKVLHILAEMPYKPSISRWVERQAEDFVKAYEAKHGEIVLGSEPEVK